MCECCCMTKTGMLFKLSLLGVFMSLALMLSGLFYPFNQFLVRFPLSWVLGLFLILPSLTLYYAVKEKFWAEIEKNHKKPQSKA